MQSAPFTSFATEIEIFAPGLEVSAEVGGGRVESAACLGSVSIPLTEAAGVTTKGG